MLKLTRSSQALSYAFATASVVAAILIRRMLDPILGEEYPFATLFFAVTISAWYGGFGPALLAVILGALAAPIFLMQPSLVVQEWREQAGLILYISVGLGIALLGGTMKTAQRRAEANARSERSQRGQLQVTLESIGDAVIVTDAGGQITLLNPTAQTLTGWKAGAASGQPLERVFNIINENTGHPVESPAARVMKEGAIVGLANHTVLVSRNANRYPIEDSGAPIKDASGSITGVVLVFRDVTQRRLADKALREAHDQLERRVQERTAELAKANAAKDAFLAHMSHELRTPLNAIIGFTGTMLMKLPGPLTTDQEKQLRTVQASAKHLLSLINDLLDLAKIESGKIELNPEPLILQTVVQEIASTLRPLAEQKGLQLEVQPYDPSLVLHADRRAFTQIVMNLLSNAVKFTEKGSVKVEVDQNELRIIDTGIGIAPEDQARLFQPFSQLSSTVQGKAKGTGLGLHLSRKLAELMDTRIGVKSDLGKGSIFTLSWGPSKSLT